MRAGVGSAKVERERRSLERGALGAQSGALTLRSRILGV